MLIIDIKFLPLCIDSLGELGPDKLNILDGLTIFIISKTLSYWDKSACRILTREVSALLSKNLISCKKGYLRFL